MSWSSASTCEGPAVGLARCPGGELALRRAVGPAARARGLLGDRRWTDPAHRPPMGLWLGRTPQVHTFGMDSAVAAVTLGRHGNAALAASESMVVEAISVLVPGRVGPWRWRWPITIELRCELLDELALIPGASLKVTWAGAGRG